SDDRAAWTKKQTRDRNDEYVQRDVRRLDNVRVPDQPRDEKDVDRDLNTRLQQNIFGETKDDCVNDRKTSDDGQYQEAFVAWLLRFTCSNPKRADNGEHDGR